MTFMNIAKDFDVQSCRSYGCFGDHHVPEPWIGDPPGPRWYRCMCRAKAWNVEKCPTCGQDHAVELP